VDFGDWSPFWNLTSFRTSGNLSHGPGRTTNLPSLWAHLILALPPGGKGPRTFQCLDCEQPDPLKTDKVLGWLKSELRPPE